MKAEARKVSVFAVPCPPVLTRRIRPGECAAGRGVPGAELNLPLAEASPDQQTVSLHPDS